MLLLLALSFALLLGIGGWLLYRLGELPEEAAGLTRDLQATIALNQSIHRQVHRATGLLERQLDGLDPAFPEEFRRLNYAVGELETRYLTLRIEPEERLAVERIRATYDHLGLRAAQVYSLLQAGERDRALATLDQLRRDDLRLDADFHRLDDLQIRKLEAVMGRLGRSVLRGERALLLLAAGVIVLLALFLAELRRLVLQPIRSILQTAEGIRAGDLTARAPVQREDELGRLATGFNFMADTLAQDQAELERRVEERTREVQELQETLIQTAKLSALGELVGGVAHELNNPLTAILGYAELTRGKLERQQADSDLLDAQQVIISQVDRCKRIVSGLSQFARRQKPRLEPVRLNRLVERVLALRAYELEARNVTLVRDYDPADPELAADSYKLEQVVLNLLNNAHDAIRESGRGQGTIRVTTRFDDSGAAISIEDDGAGIREPDRIFEPFYTTKEVGQGTGLGLAVCYGIVEEHGGTIRAENRHPGARLTVTLPSRPPQTLGAAGAVRAALRAVSA